MESRVEQAIQRHKNGYNCAQAVVCTYCDLFGIEEVTAFRMAEGLGLGMGNMAGTCGAIAGACMLAGLKNSCGNLEAPSSKQDTYRKYAKVLMEKFEAKAGAVTCKDLKGIETGKMLHTCPNCVRDAAVLVEEVLLQEA